MIISLTPAAHRRALEYTRHANITVEYWPMPDPASVSGRNRRHILAQYQATCERILRYIQHRFGQSQ